ncbi:hypothetical protein [Stutzerimonas stutzeri]|uniref:hypothetical protein n=1 Tax=Stutzerimonas stutzeri TaxID=316 RepID=UPI0015E34929|nr:hypothetical protein [Stutzerimonas stutzeri]MBA1280271.1 hypothetical protein [Stutzerimonas stutzeri]
MVAKHLKLTAELIGEGPKLFHVNLLADSWEEPTMWLVAASNLDDAFDTAMAQYANIDRGEFRDGCDGYEIGEFAS